MPIDESARECQESRRAVWPAWAAPSTSTCCRRGWSPEANGLERSRSALVSTRSFSAAPPDPDTPEPDSTRKHPHQADPHFHIVGVLGSGKAKYDPEHAEQHISSSERTPPPCLFPTQTRWSGIWHGNHLPRCCARKRRARRGVPFRASRVPEQSENHGHRAAPATARKRATPGMSPKQRGTVIRPSNRGHRLYCSLVGEIMMTWPDATGQTRRRSTG